MASDALLTAVNVSDSLDSKAHLPLHRQLYLRLKQSILTGQLKPGAKIPATRCMAEQMNVSRTTIISAIDQLVSEGYLNTKPGSGTFVAPPSADRMIVLTNPGVSHSPLPTAKRSISSRSGGNVWAPPLYTQALTHRWNFCWLADYQVFPRDIWGNLVAKHGRKFDRRSFYPEKNHAGYLPLREAVASYIGLARGVRCTPEQVIITAGSQQALHIAAEVLLDPGDPAWIENPGYLGARAALLSAGARLTPVPVDTEGIDVQAGLERCPNARLAYVTPAHQFPVGMVMSTARRRALLQWARTAGSWIIEDDYDSEFCYVGNPPPALKSIDRDNTVIFTGTFSKIMFPSLRIGYMVVPEDLIDTFTGILRTHAMYIPALEQKALADFIVEGYFERHVRRMRYLYAERQAALMEETTNSLQGLMEVPPQTTGMHLLGHLPEGMDDVQTAKRLSEIGIAIASLSPQSLEPLHRGGLMLGFSLIPAKQMHAHVHRLGCALRRCRRSAAASSSPR